MPDATCPLLQNLPHIYHSSDALRVLLSEFRAVLLGPEIDGGEGLEQKIANISRLFSPDETPEEFLPWLAQWVALGQHQGLTGERLRNLISRIVPLYTKRGTKKYVSQLLELSIPEITVVGIRDQQQQGLTLGKSSLGKDSWLEGEKPFWFEVVVRDQAKKDDAMENERFKENWRERIRSIIDLAKPAHTTYGVRWEYETEGNIGTER